MIFESMPNKNVSSSTRADSVILRDRRIRWKQRDRSKFPILN